MTVRLTALRSIRKVHAVVMALVLALALLPAGLARTALAAPAAAGQHLPLKGALTALEIGVFNPGPPPTISVTADGSGNATRLGQFTYHYTVVIHPNPDGSATGTLFFDFTAANGDHLFSVGEGFGDPLGHVVEQHNITGGTGHFAGATGRFTIDRQIGLVTQITVGTIDGYVVLPKKEVRSTASFTIPAGQCPNLPAGVSVKGSGSRVLVTDVTVNADASSQEVVSDVVQGTATGSNGQAYTFYYANTSTWDAAATAGGPVKVKMYDLFLLQTNPPAAGNSYALRNGFTWRWSYTPPAGPFDVWPPANFQPSVTSGEPLNADASAKCDPL